MTKINVKIYQKNAYILLVVSVSKTTLAKNLTSFYKIEHTLQPRNFTPTYTRGNLLHFCFKRHDKNVPSSKGKDLKTTEHLSTGEWIHTGIYSHNRILYIGEDEWTTAISNMSIQNKTTFEKANPRRIHRIYFLKAQKNPNTHIIKLFF